MTRDEAEERARRLGAQPSTSVSRRTGLVVAGSNPGSKLVRARKLAVQESVRAERFREVDADFYRAIGIRDEVLGPDANLRPAPVG